MLSSVTSVECPQHTVPKGTAIDGLADTLTLALGDRDGDTDLLTLLDADALGLSDLLAD